MNRTFRVKIFFGPREMRNENKKRPRGISHFSFLIFHLFVYFILLLTLNYSSLKQTFQKFQKYPEMLRETSYSHLKKKKNKQMSSGRFSFEIF